MTREKSYGTNTAAAAAGDSGSGGLVAFTADSGDTGGGHSRAFGRPPSESRVEAIPLLGKRDHRSSSDDAGSGVEGKATSRGLGDEVLLSTRKRPYKSLGWSLIAVRTKS